MAEEIRPAGLNGSVVGGGRIECSGGGGGGGGGGGNCMVNIYGYSKTFGRAAGCNEASCAIGKEAYPEWRVSWSDDGY